MWSDEHALIRKAPRKKTRGTTRKRPAEWVFSPLAHVGRHGEDQIVVDARGDASIKQLLWVRILVGPSASSANFFSKRRCVASEARFTGFIAPKRTTMWRTNGLSIRQIAGLSARFLQAMIVEWLFPMQIRKTPARLNGTRCSESRGWKPMPREAEDFLRCNVDRHHQFESRKGHASCRRLGPLS